MICSQCKHSMHVRIHTDVENIFVVEIRIFVSHITALSIIVVLVPCNVPGAFTVQQLGELCRYDKYRIGDSNLLHFIADKV